MKNRKNLNQIFIDQLYEDFNHHGVQAIERVRVEHPDVYLKIVTSLVPKEMHIEKEETLKIYVGMEETARLFNLAEPAKVIEAVVEPPAVAHTEH